MNSEVKSKYSIFPHPLLIEITKEAISKLDETDTKIVLFDAEWSGTSRMCAHGILRRLQELKIIIPVFYINIDHLSAETIKTILGVRSHGNGEALYFKMENAKQGV